jgi:hypothetical protein
MLICRRAMRTPKRRYERLGPPDSEREIEAVRTHGGIYVDPELFDDLALTSAMVTFSATCLLR